MCTGAIKRWFFDDTSLPVYELCTGAIKSWFFDDTSLPVYELCTGAIKSWFFDDTSLPVYELCTGAIKRWFFDDTSLPVYELCTGAIKRWFFDDTNLQPDYLGGVVNRDQGVGRTSWRNVDRATCLLFIKAWDYLRDYLLDLVRWYRVGGCVTSTLRVRGLGFRV
jgi:hypothetical protein